MGSDFGSTKHHAGRKNHTCEWCGQVIPKGEIFAHFTGMWDNEFQNWRMHEECYEVSKKDDSLQDGFMPYDNERPTKP